MVLGEWRAHPARVILAAAAIAIGVALGFAVYLVNRSALETFAKAIDTVSGTADLQVHSVTAAGFDEGLYPALAHIPGVAAASAVVELNAHTDAGASLTVLGLDVLRAAAVTPGLVGQGAHGFDGQAAYLSQAAMTALSAKAGSPVTVTAAGHSAVFTVSGSLPGAGEDQAIVVIDIADAQWRFGSLGRLQRVDLKFGADTSTQAVQAAIARALPPDAQIVTQRQESHRSDALSRAYRVNLEMLAMVALMTGGFLVYSGQSLSVARRRPQFALLRVLGLSQRHLILQIVIEGAAVGLAGGIIGVAAGTGFATLALALFGGDLGGGYFQGARPQLAFAPGAGLVFLLLGLIAALAGALWPALQAARSRPAVALKNADLGIDPRRKPPLVTALVLLMIGGALAFAPPIGGLPLLGYGSMAAILAGGIALMPALARAILGSARRLAGDAPATRLAFDRLYGAPGQAAVALCGIVASVSLMAAMGIMVASFRGSVDDWLGQILPADLYMRLPDLEAGGFDPAAQDRLAHAPGVAAIEFRKVLTLRLAPDQPPAALNVVPIDPAAPQRALPLISTVSPLPAGETAVWASEPMARLYHLKPGHAVTVPLGGQPRRLYVRGIWRDYARQFGALAIGDTDYVRLTGDRFRSQVAVTLAPGADPLRTVAALRAVAPPGIVADMTFTESKSLRAMALKIFDRSFAVTYALEAIAIGIGLAGVAATFSAQTLARTREFGMLRHVGALKRQIVAMLALEGALLGAVGALAGLSLGAVLGQILIQVINPQSFNWSMDTRWPMGLLLSLFVVLVAASAGTAVLSGRRALSSSTIRAVREDW